MCVFVCVRLCLSVNTYELSEQGERMRLGLEEDVGLLRQACTVPSAAQRSQKHAD